MDLLSWLSLYEREYVLLWLLANYNLILCTREYMSNGCLWLCWKTHRRGAKLCRQNRPRETGTLSYVRISLSS